MRSRTPEALWCWHGAESPALGLAALGTEGVTLCLLGCKDSGFCSTGPVAGEGIRNPVPEAGDQLPQGRAADSTEGNARGGSANALSVLCSRVSVLRFQPIYA